MQLLKYRSDLHEPYQIVNYWFLRGKNLANSKKYCLYNPERTDVLKGEKIYDPFFVGVVDKINQDLNSVSDTTDYYVYVFDSLKEIEEFKKTNIWNSFKDSGFCKIRRISVFPKSSERYLLDINMLKDIGEDVSECGYTLLFALSRVYDNSDRKIADGLKSKKEIKRLIESGAVKIRKNDEWVVKNNPNEYLAPEPTIFKIGKKIFFKIS